MQAAPEPHYAFTTEVPVIIRKCTREDLPGLEWFGLYSHHREIFEKAYERQERGENIMLVAVANTIVVGQVWIDLTASQDEKTGVIWAVRVFPALRRIGIGGHLIAAAEQYLRERGYTTVELGVQKHNTYAQAFYEHRGYEYVGEQQVGYSYTSPEGELVHVPHDEWVMRKQLTVPA